MYIYFANTIGLILMHYFFVKNKNPNLEYYCWIFAIFFLSIFIGLRYEIGGDWYKYNFLFNEFGQGSEGHSFRDVIEFGLIYVLINKIAFYTGIQIVGVNFICALIFMFALASFLDNSKNRWLALAVSFPIIIVVLGMGYTRQGLAFAFSLFLIKSLENKKLFNSIIYFLLAIFSHKTAVFISLLFPLYFWFHKKYIYAIIFFSIPVLFGVFNFYHFKHLFHFYVGSGQHMTAYGAIPRTFLILIVALFFLNFRKSYKHMNDYQMFMYSSISYIILFTAPFSILTSIMADRLLLYMYSIKIAVVSFANLKDKKINIAIFIVISLYFIYFALWACFGNNAFSWIPYNFVLFHEEYAPRHIVQTYIETNHYNEKN